MSVEYAFATRDDEKELRRILKDNPMPGDVELTFSREPDYFLATEVEGENTRVLTAKDNGRVVCLGSMSVKDLFLNGSATSVGYLSGLRMEKNYRGGMILARGFSIFKKMHTENRVPFYLTTIAEDNKYANRILGANRPGMAIYNKRGLYLTRAISIYGRKAEKNRFNIIRGNNENINSIIECINRNGSFRQFYPNILKDKLLAGGGAYRGLGVSDFYAAEEGGKIIGACAKWDQGSFKQNIITGYSGIMAVIKPLYNAASALLRYNPLPEKGGKLKSFYISFMAADDDNPEILESLVRRVYNDSVGQGYHYFLAGLFQGDPLEKAFKAYVGVTYKTRLYLVCWEDGVEAVSRIDNRLPYLEAATL